jgi:DNA-binding beta-propeller fold protein YncE
MMSSNSVKLAIVVTCSYLASTCFAAPLDQAHPDFPDSHSAEQFRLPVLAATTSSKLAGGHFAYISDYENGTVTVCQLDDHKGTLNSCTDSGVGAVFERPVGIALNPSGDRAYVASQQGARISVCKVKAGKFSNCDRSPVRDFPSVSDVAIDPAGKHLYVTSNENLSAVLSCGLSTSDGALTACSQTGTEFFSPTSITVDPSGSYALVTNFSEEVSAGRRLTSCKIDAVTGNLNECVSGGSGFFYPSSVKIGLNGNYAYVADYYEGNVNKCSYDRTTGMVSNCMSSGGAGFALPTDVEFYGDRAFITVNKNSIVSCKVSASTGFLDKCVDAGASRFANPSNIVVR